MTGSLLVIGELLANKDFMMPRLRIVCESVLPLRESKSRLVREAVIALMPKLAAFHPESFVRGYLNMCLDYLLETLSRKDEKERESSNLGRFNHRAQQQHSYFAGLHEAGSLDSLLMNVSGSLGDALEELEAVAQSGAGGSGSDFQSLLPLSPKSSFPSSGLSPGSPGNSHGSRSRAGGSNSGRHGSGKSGVAMGGSGNDPSGGSRFHSQALSTWTGGGGFTSPTSQTLPSSSSSGGPMEDFSSGLVGSGGLLPMLMGMTSAAASAATAAAALEVGRPVEAMLGWNPGQCFLCCLLSSCVSAHPGISRKGFGYHGSIHFDSSGAVSISVFQ